MKVGCVTYVARYGEKEMTFTEACGWVATVLFFISYFPQLMRTYRSKSVEDISIEMWYILVIAHTTLLLHGIGVNSDPIIFNSLLGLSCETFMILMYHMFKDPRKRQARRLVNGMLKQMMKEFKERDNEKD